MNKLKIYETIVAAVDKKISMIINQESISLCNQLNNGQNMINSDKLINEIEQLNIFLQRLFQNGFNESELILEKQIKYNNYNKNSFASILFCKRINEQLNKLLYEYSDNIIYYDIVFDRINFINKLFIGDEYGDYFLVKDGSKRKSYVAI